MTSLCHLGWYFPNGSAATGRHYSNYKAESEHWYSLAVDSKQKRTMSVFLTDALSVLPYLTNNTMPYLAKALQLLSNNCRVAIQWIPPSSEFLEMSKQTSMQWNVHIQGNLMLMWATKKRSTISKQLWGQVKRMMPTTLLVGQSK